MSDSTDPDHTFLCSMVSDLDLYCPDKSKSCVVGTL